MNWQDPSTDIENVNAAYRNEPIRWRHDGAEAVLHDGRLSIYAEPSMTRADGVVAVGIDAPWLAELLSAATALRWNSIDGQEDGSLIVERESWTRFRRALRCSMPSWLS